MSSFRLYSLASDSPLTYPRPRDRTAPASSRPCGWPSVDRTASTASHGADPSSCRSRTVRGPRLPASTPTSVAIPAAARAVACRSSWIAGRSSVVPGLHVARPRDEERHADAALQRRPLRPAERGVRPSRSTVVPFIVGPPLSLMNIDQRVLGQLRVGQLLRHACRRRRPSRSSSRRRCVASSSLIASELLQPRVVRLHRRVDGVERQVQEERLRLVGRR